MFHLVLNEIVNVVPWVFKSILEPDNPIVKGISRYEWIVDFLILLISRSLLLF